MAFFLCLWFRASLIYNNCPARCNTKQSIYYSASSLFMFRVSTTKLAWPRWREVAAQKIWPVPEDAVTVLCIPNDGYARWSRGSVLAVSTQVCGLKPGRSRRKKILSTPSFGGEVKPPVPCRRFAACKRSLNLRGSRNLGKITTGHLSRPQFHLSLLGSLASLRTEAGESNGKLPPSTCPGCSVPEPYRSHDWALVPAKPGLQGWILMNEWWMDGCGWHPKHVEWSCRIIKRLLCVAPRWTIINILKWLLHIRSVNLKCIRHFLSPERQIERKCITFHGILNYGCWFIGYFNDKESFTDVVGRYTVKWKEWECGLVQDLENCRNSCKISRKMSTSLAGAWQFTSLVNKQMAGACKCGNEPYGSTECGKFL